MLIFLVLLHTACQEKKKESEETRKSEMEEEKKFAHPPLVAEPFTADPSAHVFDGKIYIYPSHDIPAGIPSDDWGAHFAMEDYRVYSMEAPDGPVTDHGTALHVDDIPWAARQLWAPDAAEKAGKYYLYFPAKDTADVFKIGVAISEQPEGPFVPEPDPIPGTYSIDPAVFQDGDQYYLYFGGIWGGQLQRWKDGEYHYPGDQPTDGEPAPDQPALAPKVARLAPDMKNLAEKAKDVLLLDENGDPIQAGDHDKRFFEAAWVHKHQDTYYFSYSTGDTHHIAYATGDTPYGPFTYQGNILAPVAGWTTHHSIVSYDGNWYLFYHDTEISGETHLRNIKMAPLKHLPDGSIATINP
nr:glycoside hydrolase family 43 protein [Cyclobacterium sp. SYSU L10401]